MNVTCYEAGFMFKREMSVTFINCRRRFRKEIISL